jgi:hypothetical protein
MKNIYQITALSLVFAFSLSACQKEAAPAPTPCAKHAVVAAFLAEDNYTLLTNPGSPAVVHQTALSGITEIDFGLCQIYPPTGQITTGSNGITDVGGGNALAGALQSALATCACGL